MIPTVIVAVVLLISVVTDLLRKKIYNWVTFPAILAGFIVNCALWKMHGLLGSLGGIAVGSVWLILFVLRGATGAGDVKLFYAVGALMGPGFTAWTLLYSALAGGVLGIVYALRRGVLGHTMKNAMLGAHVLSTVKSPDSLKSMADQSKAGSMPTAPPIAIGALITWWAMAHQLI